jgi:hypothetical protein
MLMEKKVVDPLEFGKIRVAIFVIRAQIITLLSRILIKLMLQKVRILKQIQLP